MKQFKINLGRGITNSLSLFQYHTESYYQRNGKCERCGQEAGMFIPLKIWELITGDRCKK